MADKQLPEARQCTDEGHIFYGATAVRDGVNSWGVMVPRDVSTGRGGGHWATNAEVESWRPLDLAPTPPPEPAGD